MKLDQHIAPPCEAHKGGNQEGGLRPDPVRPKARRPPWQGRPKFHLVALLLTLSVGNDETRFY